MLICSRQITRKSSRETSDISDWGPLVSAIKFAPYAYGIDVYNYYTKSDQ